MSGSETPSSPMRPPQPPPPPFAPPVSFPSDELKRLIYSTNASNSSVDSSIASLLTSHYSYLNGENAQGSAPSDVGRDRARLVSECLKDLAGPMTCDARDLDDIDDEMDVGVEDDIGLGEGYHSMEDGDGDLSPQTSGNDGDPLNKYNRCWIIRQRALLCLLKCLECTLLSTPPPPAPPPLHFLTLLGDFLSSRVQDAPSSHMCLDITDRLLACIKLHLPKHPQFMVHLLTIALKVLENTSVNDLTRPARSAAFNLIINAASAEPPGDAGQTTAEMASLCASLTSLACHVLRGEKDPRCLQSGLEGLRLCQRNLAPICIICSQEFPSDEILEAIGVYYPVTFQPPPGDKHGITNLSLSTAVNHVLAGESAAPYNMNYVADNSKALEMVIERIYDSGEEGSAGVGHGVRDVRFILKNAMGGVASFGEAIEGLREAIIKGFKEIERSGGGGGGGDSMGGPDDSLDLLDLVFLITKDVDERGDGNLKEEFIVRLVKELSGDVLENPESLNGRCGMRLLCGIGKAGGEPLGIALKSVIFGLIDIVTTGGDSDRVKAAAAGMGMLFACSQGQASRQPCPSRSYASKAMTALAKLSVSDRIAEANLSIAAILIGRREKVVEDDQVERFAEELLKEIVSCASASAGNCCSATPLCLIRQYFSNTFPFQLLAREAPPPPSSSPWMHSMSYCLGSLGGSPLYPAVGQAVVARVVEASVEGDLDFSFSLLVEIIALSCKGDKGVCRQVIDKLGKVFCERMDGAEEGKTPVPAAIVLENIVNDAGDNARQCLEEGEVAGNILRSYERVKGSQGDEVVRRKFAVQSVRFVSKIFEAPGGGAIKSDTVKYFRDLLESLARGNSQERERVMVGLPILASAVRGEGSFDGEDAILLGMISPLSDIALDGTLPSEARGASLDAIKNIIQRKGGEDKARPGLEASILPYLNQSALSVEKFVNGIHCLAIVGGAAACRGGPSSISADRVVGILADLVCEGASPGNVVVPAEIDLAAAKVVGAEGLGKLMSLEGGGRFWRQRCASLTLGRIVTVIHNAMGNPSGADGGIEESVEKGGKTDHLQVLGGLIAASNFACCLPLAVLANNKWGESLGLVDCLLAGLVLAHKRSPDAAGWELGAWGVLVKTCLASFVRLTGGDEGGRAVWNTAQGHHGQDMSDNETASDSLSKKLCPILVPMLLFFAGRPKSHGSNDCMEPLMALQCLMNLAQSDLGEELCVNIVCEQLFDVLSHPSAEVRKAAVKVRNVFILIGEK